MLNRRGVQRNGTIIKRRVTASKIGGCLGVTEGDRNSHPSQACVTLTGRHEICSSLAGIIYKRKTRAEALDLRWFGECLPGWRDCAQPFETGAREGDRTPKPLKRRQVLSLLRLPVSPLSRHNRALVSHIQSQMSTRQTCLVCDTDFFCVWWVRHLRHKRLFRLP